MLLFILREGRKKKTQERERERDLRFFYFWLSGRTLYAVVIKSSRARTPRAMNSYPPRFFHHRQEKTRTLIRDSLSLSVFTLSLSLCSCCCCCLFSLFTHKSGPLDTKIKTLFPPLSLVWTKVYAHHRLKLL